MPRKATRLHHDHPPLNTQYLAFSHNDRSAWVQPTNNLEQASHLAMEMLAAGAYLAIVLDVWSHSIVFDATHSEYPGRPSVLAHSKTAPRH